MMKNKFKGRCTICKCVVYPQNGWVQKVGDQWVAFCYTHAKAKTMDQKDLPKLPKFEKPKKKRKIDHSGFILERFIVD